MYALITFIPAASTESVSEALFAAGAGTFGAYDRCSFVVRGEGRFRPLPGSSPRIGETGRDERVAEDRVELVVPDDRVDAVLSALRSAHPYEEPALYLWRLDDRCVLGGPGTGGRDRTGRAG